MHPEDDPMEKHNHPTARQRLGDSAAGLGAAATLTATDADAIRAEVARRAVRRPAACTSRRESCSTGSAGSRGFTGPNRDMPRIRRIVGVQPRPVLHRP